MFASPDGRDHLIMFQRKTVVPDEVGEGELVWSDLGDEYASVRFGAAQERREAAQTRAVQAATFGVLDNNLTRSVSVTDRIAFDGGIWDVTSNVPSRELNAGRDITAIRVAP